MNINAILKICKVEKRVCSSTLSLPILLFPSFKLNIVFMITNKNKLKDIHIFLALQSYCICICIGYCMRFSEKEMGYLTA